MTAKPTICQNIQDQIDGLSQYQLRQAEPSDPVFLHAKSCPACRVYLEQAYALDQTLDHWKIPSPQRNINAAVMGEIAQHEHQKAQTPSLWRQLHQGLTRRVPLSVAALLVLSLSLVGSLGYNTIQRQQLTHTRLQLIAVQSSLPQESERIVHVSLTPSVNHQPSPQVRPTLHTPRPAQSFFISPQHSPSSMVIILGAPPMITLDAQPEYESLYDNTPL